MTRPLCRALRLLAWRPAIILAAGVALAFTAEGSSVALLALSGWFIACCYLSGAGLLPGFSYLTPSGGVRSLAISRILARYAENLVSHAATLGWLTRLRAGIFRDAAHAGTEPLRRLGTGEALDRAMSDADTLDRVLIRAIVPVLLAVAGMGASTAVIASLHRPAAAAFLLGAVATAVFAFTVGRAADPASRRGAARARLVETVDAWEELACLGALDALRSAAATAFTDLAAAEDATGKAQSRTRLATDLGAAVTTTAVLATARIGPDPVPLADATLIALLTVGTLDVVAGLVTARLAWWAASTAAARLAALTTPASTPPTAGSPLPVRAALVVRELPLSPDGAAAERLTAQFAPVRTTVVQGRSGTGKTTLLRALAGELPSTGVTVGGLPPASFRPGDIVLVPHDDHVFGGTVAANLRLADPALPEERIRKLLDAMCLSERGIDPDTAVGTDGRSLSGGEHRRLCLARAIAGNPGVLLLDEPTEGLDSATAQHVLAQVRALLPAATIVAAIHDREAAAVAGLDADWLSLDIAPAGVRDWQKPPG
jgi:ATP-binding cassette subfamily C protein CydC